MQLATYAFNKICEICLVLETDGSHKVFAPQSSYNNKRNLPINKYGSGPFGKFSIPGHLKLSGVYALVANDTVKYIGECTNLSSRYNMGYGTISPRNCYKGGQETNCRINNLIYEQIKSDNKVELWFHETKSYKQIEHELRVMFRPEWNKS